MSADPRLDRLPEFDDRSRVFPIRSILKAKNPRSYTWSCAPVLDQGSEGACVGFSFAHEMAARPKVNAVSRTLAYSVYDLARDLDEYPGDDYEGTSVLGGIKAGQKKGYYGEYRWAFGLDDLVLAIGYAGPVVLGINWYESMFDTDSKGFLHVAGDVAGGHAILARGVSLSGGYILLHNSWGPSWGRSGMAKLALSDVARLLQEDGEACVPVQRYLVGPA